MADTKESIAQAACLLVHFEPITSFTDNTAEAKAINANYHDLVENELALYPWRFASKKATMNRLLDEPEDPEWDAAYQIPPDIIAVQTVLIQGMTIQYDRYYDQVYCNATEDDAVVIDGTFKTEPEKWPPYFTRLIEFRLAEILASGVAMRGDLANYFKDKADMQSKLARHRDSAGQTAKAIRSTRFRSARRNARTV